MFFGFISKNTFAIMMHHMTINMFIQLILDSMDKNNIVYIIWYYSEDVVKPVTVSYTHLDVYKRQRVQY